MLPHGRNVLVDALEQQVFCVTPANAISVGLAQGCGLWFACESLVNLEQCRAFNLLGLSRLARVGDDARNEFFELGAR